MFLSRIVAYIKLRSDIPKGNTPVALTRSFLVVTIRSIKELDVVVCLVASCMTFYILNISKMERSLLVFALNKPLVEKSQLKFLIRKMLEDFSHAFSKRELTRSKKMICVRRPVHDCEQSRGTRKFDV